MLLRSAVTVVSSALSMHRPWGVFSRAGRQAGRQAGRLRCASTPRGARLSLGAEPCAHCACGASSGATATAEAMQAGRLRSTKLGVGLRVLDHLALEVGRCRNGRAAVRLVRRRDDGEPCDGGCFASPLCLGTNQPVISLTPYRFPSQFPIGFERRFETSLQCRNEVVCNDDGGMTTCKKRGVEQRWNQRVSETVTETKAVEESIVSSKAMRG
jgi:hypothetical protein